MEGGRKEGRKGGIVQVSYEKLGGWVEGMMLSWYKGRAEIEQKAYNSSSR